MSCVNSNMMCQKHATAIADNDVIFGMLFIMYAVGYRPK